MGKLNETVLGWLSFKDIEGTDPDPETTIVHGEEAEELTRIRGHGEEQSDE